MLGERNQMQPHPLGFHLCELSRIGKSVETGSRLVVAWGWAGGEWRGTANRFRIPFLGGGGNAWDLVAWFYNTHANWSFQILHCSCGNQIYTPFVVVACCGLFCSLFCDFSKLFL